MREDTFARRLFCTMVILTQGKLMHGVTYCLMLHLYGDKKRHFCTMAILTQGETYARESLLHGVTYCLMLQLYGDIKRNFCTGLFSRKYLCIAKTLNQGSTALHNLRAYFPRKVARGPHYYEKPCEDLI